MRDFPNRKPLFSLGNRLVFLACCLPAWPLRPPHAPHSPACLAFYSDTARQAGRKKNERRNQLGVMEQNEPFPNPASKLPNLNFSVYAMVDCAPFFVGSVDAPRRARGRLCFHFSCTEEARSGVCFTERAFSKTRILVPFFWTKTCDFLCESYPKNGKTSERPAESASARLVGWLVGWCCGVVVLRELTSRSARRTRSEASAASIALLSITASLGSNNLALSVAGTGRRPSP